MKLLKMPGKSENDPGRPSPHLYENRKEPGADREATEANAGEMKMEQKVIYNGQILTLTRFWATGEPCLWITDPQQIGMPKMEFVGGHPDEYCIFLKNLTETELSQITSVIVLFQSDSSGKCSIRPGGLPQIPF